MARKENLEWIARVFEETADNERVHAEEEFQFKDALGGIHVFIGGDNVMFWGPLAWTIIFGLTYATVLTLVMVPSMYLIAERLRRPMEKFYGTKYVALFGFTGPLFFIFVGIMYLVKKLQGKKVWNGLTK